MSYAEKIYPHLLMFPTQPSLKTACRLILDPAADGAWNMAVDEALAESVASTGQPVLRFYEWQPVTLSLGYFQRRAERETHPASLACPVTRRLTGGGAIVHDDELTYCLCLPVSHLPATDAVSLYAVVHESLIESLADWGVSARLCGAEAAAGETAQPFLCFQRRAAADVLLGEHKVAGSAQRRRSGTIIQHGSVLLGRSQFAPELAGVNDLASRTITPVALQHTWQERLAVRLGLTLSDSAATSAEIGRARKLAQTRYAAARWIERR